MHLGGMQGNKTKCAVSQRRRMASLSFLLFFQSHYFYSLQRGDNIGFCPVKLQCYFRVSLFLFFFICNVRLAEHNLQTVLSSSNLQSKPRSEERHRSSPRHSLGVPSTEWLVFTVVGWFTLKYDLWSSVRIWVFVKTLICLHFFPGSSVFGGLAAWKAVYLLRSGGDFKGWGLREPLDK